MSSLEARLRAAIVDVPDFPRPGIVFKDLTPVYEDAGLFQEVVEAGVKFGRACGAGAVAAIEMRGVMAGAAVAHAMELPLVLVRKAGRLPRRKLREEYALEYGTDALEVHADAALAGRRVLIVDDLLATGGTAQAAARLVERAGGESAGFFFVVELGHLAGRTRLGSTPVRSLVVY